VNELADNQHTGIHQLGREERKALSLALSEIYNQKIKDWKCKFEESADDLEILLKSLLESFQEYRSNQCEEYFKNEVLGRWKCFSSKAESLYKALKALPGEGVLIP